MQQALSYTQGFFILNNLKLKNMDFWIQNGIITKTKRVLGKTVIGLTNFLHIQKQILEELNVPYFDTCCDTAESKIRVPVVYNTAEERFERFDPETNSYVEVVIEHPEEEE